MSYEKQIIELIQSDKSRMRALSTVRTLDLPDWLIAAGFVRNLVWGSVFNKTIPLNDVDVIYFCQKDFSKERDIMLEKNLHDLAPEFTWSVKNQARMHIRHNDAPYKDSLDAMRFWPEKQTCIGVLLDSKNDLVVRHCFDLSLQFDGFVNYNPTRSLQTFMDRVSTKEWLKTWPALQIKT